MATHIMAKPKTVTLVLVLRVAAAALCFCAAIVMVTSHQTTSFFGITVEARFEYTPAFEFLVAVTAIICAYSVILIFVSTSSRLVLATDVLAAMLLTASLSTAGTIGYLGKKGNVHSGWMPVCDQIRKFCDQTMGAIVCNFVALLLYTSIAFYNILKTHGLPM